MMNPFKRIKQLEKRVEELSNKIVNLNLEIYKLRDPLKYSIGDIVDVTINRSIECKAFFKKVPITKAWYSDLITYPGDVSIDKCYSVLAGNEILEDIREHEISLHDTSK